MYFAMDMGTSNTRVWLCDHKRIIDFKKAPFGAKMGKMKGKPILFECLLRKLGANYDKKFQYQTTFL